MSPVLKRQESFRNISNVVVEEQVIPSMSHSEWLIAVEAKKLQKAQLEAELRELASLKPKEIWEAPVYEYCFTNNQTGKTQDFYSIDPIYTRDSKTSAISGLERQRFSAKIEAYVHSNYPSFDITKTKEDKVCYLYRDTDPNASMQWRFESCFTHSLSPSEVYMPRECAVELRKMLNEGTFE